MKASIFMVGALAGAGTPTLAENVTGTVLAGGERLVAISPRLPDGSLSTAEKNALTFDVLSDIAEAVAGLHSLVYALPEELRAVLRSNNKALPAINGDESWELPVPATNVIARNGRLALAYLDVEHRKGLDPEAIVAGSRFAGA
jgi:peroxiredoxin